MKLYFWLPLFFSFSVQASPLVAKKSLEWLQCPPKNPYYKEDSCQSRCCSGSNWDLTCMGFVQSVKWAALEEEDLELQQGNPLPGQKFGNVERAFAAMEKAGRAHYKIDEMVAGSAVFFKIDGFKPGHIAIFSGLYNQAGDPLIVSTGGPKWGSGIHLESLSKMSKRPYWHFLGWADL